MATGIQVVWWIGLIGALRPTFVIVKEVALVLRALRDIHRLAGFTRDAARGLASNMAVVPTLAGAGEPARRLRESAAAFGEAVGALERTLDDLAAGRVPRGG